MASAVTGAGDHSGPSTCHVLRDHLDLRASRPPPRMQQRPVTVRWEMLGWTRQNWWRETSNMTIDGLLLLLLPVLGVRPLLLLLLLPSTPGLHTLMHAATKSADSKPCCDTLSIIVIVICRRHRKLLRLFRPLFGNIMIVNIFRTSWLLLQEANRFFARDCGEHNLWYHYAQQSTHTYHTIQT